MKKLQYISDIHLEKRPRAFIKPKGQYLALLGDIGNPFMSNYKQFFKEIHPYFDKIFLINGNHEYNYDNSYSQTKNVISNFKNVIFLENEKYILNNKTTILGSTLWCDYKNVSEHMNSVEFIMNNVQYNTNVIVLTHYLPTYKLIVPKYRKPCFKRSQKKFATDLEFLIKPPIKYWLCGHSHCKTNIQLNSVYLGINCYDYNNSEYPLIDID